MKVRRSVVGLLACALLTESVLVLPSDDGAASAAEPTDPVVEPIRGEPPARGRSTSARPAPAKGFEAPMFDIKPPTEPVSDLAPVPPAEPTVSLPPAVPLVDRAPVVVDEPAPSATLTGFDPVTSVEVAAERGEFQTVWANTDGTSTVEISTLPVHYRDEAGWQRVDSRVVVGFDGVLTNAANAWQVRFEPMWPVAVWCSIPEASRCGSGQVALSRSHRPLSLMG